MKKLMVIGLVLSGLFVTACAGTLPKDATPRQVARAECQEWIGRHNLAQRPHRGTKQWDNLVRACVRRQLSAAGEIDRALTAF